MVMFNVEAKSSSGVGLNSGFGKIDCNRYSIAIFFTFCSSNAPEPLLF